MIGWKKIKHAFGFVSTVVALAYGGAEAKAELHFAQSGIKVSSDIAQIFSENNALKITFALQCTYQSDFLKPKFEPTGWQWPSERPNGSFVLVVADPGKNATFQTVHAAMRRSDEDIEVLPDSRYNGFVFFDPTASSEADMSVSGAANIEFSEKFLYINTIWNFIRVPDGHLLHNPHQVLTDVIIDRTTGYWQTKKGSGDIGQAAGSCELISEGNVAAGISQELMRNAFDKTISAFNDRVLMSEPVGPTKF